MDGVVTAAVRSEQAHFGGAVEQGDAGLRASGRALRASTARMSAISWFAHDAQCIDIDKALKEMQQRQHLALVFGEGGGEAVTQRSA